MYLDLGRYSIPLFCSCASSLFPTEWQEFLQPVDKVEDLGIFLSVGQTKNCWSHGEHWECASYDEQNCLATFFSGGKSSFSLDYDREVNKVLLQIHGDSKRLLAQGLQNAVMLYLAKRNAVGLHGVTVVCRDKVIVLSAPSGTGKTTLAKLLYRFGDAAIVNGDFALLSVENSRQIVFEPTPFCGSSNIRFNVRIPIDRIVFLEQAPMNEVKKLRSRCALQNLMTNIFVPEWDAELSASVRNIASIIMERIPMDVFAFLPEESAVEMFYQELVI